MTYTTKNGVTIPLDLVGDERESFIAACRGDEDCADLLERLVYGASKEIQDKKLKGCKVVKIRRKHAQLLGYLHHRPCRKTLIHRLDLLNEWGLVLNERYQQDFTVDMDAIQAAINNPPERAPRKQWSRRKGCKNTTSKTLQPSETERVQDLETLKVEYEKVVTLYADMAQKMTTFEGMLRDIQAEHAQKVVMLEEMLLQAEREHAEKVVNLQRMVVKIQPKDVDLQRYNVNSDGSASATNGTNLVPTLITTILPNITRERVTANADHLTHTPDVEKVQPFSEVQLLDDFIIKVAFEDYLAHKQASASEEPSTHEHHHRPADRDCLPSGDDPGDTQPDQLAVTSIIQALAGQETPVNEHASKSDTEVTQVIPPAHDGDKIGEDYAGRDTTHALLSPGISHRRAHGVLRDDEPASARDPRRITAPAGLEQANAASRAGTGRSAPSQILVTQEGDMTNAHHRSTHPSGSVHCAGMDCGLATSDPSSAAGNQDRTQDDAAGAARHHSEIRCVPTGGHDRVGTELATDRDGGDASSEQANAVSCSHEDTGNTPLDKAGQDEPARSTRKRSVKTTEQSGTPVQSATSEKKLRATKEKPALLASELALRTELQIWINTRRGYPLRGRAPKEAIFAEGRAVETLAHMLYLAVHEQNMEDGYSWDEYSYLWLYLTTRDSYWSKPENRDRVGGYAMLQRVAPVIAERRKRQQHTNPSPRPSLPVELPAEEQAKKQASLQRAREAKIAYLQQQQQRQAYEAQLLGGVQ